MFFLSRPDLCDSCGQTMELLQGEIDLVAQGIALLLLQWFELAGRSPQPSVGSMGEGRNDLQIA
jgi:hypothetical protein